MSTSYVILRFKGDINSLLKPPFLNELPSLGDDGSVRQRIEAVLPGTEWYEYEGKTWGDVEVHGVRLQFLILRSEIVRHFGVTARGGGGRDRVVATLCRRTGWQAINVSEGRLIELDRIKYLNTDLDIESQEDLTVLVRALEAAGLSNLHSRTDERGSSVATFAAGIVAHEPELHIAAMLSAIEKLLPSERAIWDGCIRREFNVGYDCGTEPPMFSRRLSAPLVERIAAAGASFVITLYPPDAPTRSLVPE